MLPIVVLFTVIGLGLSVFVFVAYQRILRKAKSIERGLKMVPIIIHLPPQSSDTAAGNRDVREVIREKISQAGSLYDVIAGTAQNGFKSRFYGQRHIALELIASHGLIHYYTAVPVAMVDVVKQALVTAYPGARLEEVEDYNIFNPTGRVSGVYGGEFTLKTEAAYPIATYDQLERDPMEAIINVLTSLGPDEGAAIQLLLRPAPVKWSQRSLAVVKKIRRSSGLTSTGLGFTPMDIAKAAVKSPEQQKQSIANRSPQALQMTDLEQSVVKAIEEKTRHAAYETLLRLVVASGSASRSQQIANSVIAGLALLDAPGLNGYKFVPAANVEGLVTAFIFRFFPPELRHDILSSVELATLFHLPDSQFTPTTAVDRQQSKQADGPAVLPTDGLLLGYNEYRGTKKEIRLSVTDRRRHTYIVGQTGTGKSTMLENLAVQDMLAGNGFAFIDPHGDVAERLVSMVPKHRSEDVIYFNPSDTQYPLGLNLFEFTSPEQKDFLIQEAIGMLYKLYDPGKTGIIGPRFEQWFRNAALTIMSDPAGATFIEIPKVFMDSAYLKQKFQYLQDPTVIEFWTKEMGQTSDYHKSEMLGWFASKFGAFQQNEIMRNIIGQPKSAFNLREVMDQKKILIVNLSKGQIGELNAQLLGMMFVIKFQAAAMSRANVEEDKRADFSLFVDEFQNFSTDSFATILSEARKYRLNLIVANQFIGQLTDQIKEAVFGNVGTMVSYRVGPEDAEYLVKQFAPVFDAHDLVGLPNYNAVVRLMVSGLPSQPFSLAALPPLGLANAEIGLAIKQLSAAKYGAQRQQVEAEIFNRLRAQVSPVAAKPPSSMAPAAAVAPIAPTAAAALPAAPVTPPPMPQPVVSQSAPPPAPSLGGTTAASTPTVTPVATPDASVQAVPTPTPVPQPAPGLAPAPVTPATPRAAMPQPEPDHATLNITDIVKLGTQSPTASVAAMPQTTPPMPKPSAPPAQSAPTISPVIVPPASSQPSTTPAPIAVPPPSTQTDNPPPTPVMSQPATSPKPEPPTVATGADPASPHTLAQDIKAAGLDQLIQINPLDSVINAASAILTPTEQIQAVAKKTPPPVENPARPAVLQPPPALRRPPVISAANPVSTPPAGHTPTPATRSSIDSAAIPSPPPVAATPPIVTPVIQPQIQPVMAAPAPINPLPSLPAAEVLQPMPEGVLVKPVAPTATTTPAPVQPVPPAAPVAPSAPSPTPVSLPKVTMPAPRPIEPLPAIPVGAGVAKKASAISPGEIYVDADGNVHTD